MRCKYNIRDVWRDKLGWEEYYIYEVLRGVRLDFKSLEIFGEEFFKEMKLREIWMCINILKGDLNNWWMNLELK